MTKRCGCASDQCACLIEDGDGTIVEGSGSKTAPYRINVIPVESTLTVEDEGTVVDSGVTTINFLGSGVTATTTGGGEVLVTVPGGGGGGSPLSITVQVNTYTTNGNWTKPANLLWASVEVQGAGGGGGGTQSTGASQAAAGSGGGSGGYAKKVFPASALSATEAVVVGAGGTAGTTTAGAVAGTGGSSSFHGVVGNGGLGGVTGTATIGGVTVASGAGGTASGGDLNVLGAAGFISRVINVSGTGTPVAYGSGGSSMLGVGGRQPSGAATQGVQGGGGGPSVVAASTTGLVGGVGGDGVVIVTSYIGV